MLKNSYVACYFFKLNHHCSSECRLKRRLSGQTTAKKKISCTEIPTWFDELSTIIGMNYEIILYLQWDYEMFSRGYEHYVFRTLHSYFRHSIGS